MTIIVETTVAIGDALASGPLSQFAATTSDQLRGVISDETGTGPLVFATSPTLDAPILATVRHGAEQVYTPTGATQTVDLTTYLHPRINMGSTTGNLAVTLTTVPSQVQVGTILVLNHAATPRRCNFGVSSGSLVWLGAPPDTNGDPVNTYRLYRYRQNGSVLFIEASPVSS